MLLKTQPTLFAKAKEAQPFTDNTALSSLDIENTDISTGNESFKLDLKIEDFAIQKIYWDTLSTQVSPDDVWLLPIYVGRENIHRHSYIRLKLLDTSSPNNYREVVIGNLAIRTGWQVIAVKHEEIYVPKDQYGIIGTSSEEGINLKWEDIGNFNSNSSFNRIEVSFIHFKNAVINVGSLHIAPKGWAKSAICLQADDVPVEILDRIVPIVESYGWKMTFHSTAKYTSVSNKINIGSYKELISKGHEVWGHGLDHFNLGTPGPEVNKADLLLEKRRQLREAQKFWLANGIPTAAKCMAYPYNATDNDTRDLLEELGYVCVRAGRGRYHVPWLPGLGKYDLPSMGLEKENSWSIDTEINGMIQRGQSGMFFCHTPVYGGDTTSVHPGPNSFYIDHFIRWCNLIAREESLGNLVVTTNSEYFELCGIDLMSDILIR